MSLKSWNLLPDTRWAEFDYLRGTGAVLLMIYHFICWNYGELTVSPILTRSALYVIPIYYMLSGLTLYRIYHEKILLNQGLRQFLVRRIFRIHPLLILVSLISCTYISDWGKFEFIMNISGLFGFIKWSHYFATGAWSIGNELVYYLVFPFLILFFSKNRFSLLFFLALSFGIMLWIGWSHIHSTPDRPTAYWKNFVNPLNHLVFFVAGVCIGAFQKQLTIKKNMAKIIFLTGLSVLWFYPSQELTREFYISEERRLILSIATLLVVLGISFIQFKVPELIHRPLRFLGECSYSIFLIHPIVSHYTSLFWISDWIELKILFMVILNLSISYLVFNYFEKPFILIGKKLSPSPE